DRVGAGDRVLAVTALCAAQDVSIEVVGFIANAVGVQAVATIGHREPLNRTTLFKFIESLMK
ncbi:cytidyltransferase, partial [bacterium]|nr:cytidyltransferase [bacterium]